VDLTRCFLLARLGRSPQWSARLNIQDARKFGDLGHFEKNSGSYGWRAVPPPGDGWTLDREASARKDYRVSY